MWGGGSGQWRLQQSQWPCSSRACNLVNYLTLDTTTTSDHPRRGEQNTHPPPAAPRRSKHSGLWGVLIFFWIQSITTVIKRPQWWVQFLSVLRKNSGSAKLPLAFNRCRSDDIRRKEEASEGAQCCRMVLRPLSAPPATSRKHKASSRIGHCLVLHLFPPVRGCRWSKNWLLPQGAHALPDPILFWSTSLFLQWLLSSNRRTKEGSATEKECHVSMVICNKVEPLTVPGLISEGSLIRANL